MNNHAIIKAAASKGISMAKSQTQHSSGLGPGLAGGSKKQNKNKNQKTSHTTWLHSIAEPCRFIGRKIPDATTKESCPVTLVSHGSFPTATASGLTGGVFNFGCLVLSQAMLNVATATGAVLTWTAAVDDPRLTQLSADYDTIRLVSASLFWEVQTKFLNVQGIAHHVLELDETGITTTQARYGSIALMDSAKFRERHSLSMQPNGSCIWPGPSQASSFDYYGVGTSGLINIAQTSGCLSVVFEGLDVNTVVNFTITRNFEACPVPARKNVLLASPSHHDPMDMALTMSHAPRVPKFNTIKATDVSRVAVQPVLQPYNPPSIFNEIATGINTVAGIADKVIKSPLGQMVGDLFSKIF